MLGKQVNSEISMNNLRKLIKILFLNLLKRGIVVLFLDIDTAFSKPFMQIGKYFLVLFYFFL